MCRNIKTLFNFEPPVTTEDIKAASLQYVRKISGFSKPSSTNEAAFNAAIEEIVKASSQLLSTLETNSAPKDRHEEAARAKIRSENRYGKQVIS